MAQQTLLLLAALASGIYASTTASSSANATSTMNLILPMDESQTAVMGSIMGVDATATSYYLTCPTGESSLKCGLGDGLELVEGPSVLEVHYTEKSYATIDISCALASNTASCTTTLTTADITITGTAVAASSQVTSTGSTIITDISSYSLPVTVTAGLEKLSASSSVATGGVPRATQNAALMGAAVMVGGALLI